MRRLLIYAALAVFLGLVAAQQLQAAIGDWDWCVNLCEANGSWVQYFVDGQVCRCANPN